MSLSISNSGGGFQSRLGQLQSSQQRNQARLASARRIATAADDAAGLAIARRLEAAVRSGAQAERNTSDVQGLVRTADAALQTSQDTLSRMRELTVQAQNGTLSAADRDTIQQEYDQLAAQLDQTAGSTRFGDRALLDGSLTGDGAVVAATGAEDPSTETRVEVGDAGSQALQVRGLSVSDPGTLTALDDAQELLSSERARLGALDNTLDRQQSRLATTRENDEAARSRIEDLDYARAVAESTRDRILTDLTVAGQRISDQRRARVLDLLA